MPDFTMKPSFPIASVIDASQRKVQLEQQIKQQDHENLVQGLGMIGQVGQGLADKRLKVAQALALGGQLGIPADQARQMDPEQVIKAGTIKSGAGSPLYYLLGMHPELLKDKTFLASLATGGTSQPPSTGTTPTPQPATPQNTTPLASNAPTSPMPPVEATLASISPTIPMPASPVVSTQPPQPQPMPVPIPAPPVTPVAGTAGSFFNTPMTKGQMKSLEMGQKNSPERVMTKEDAIAAGSVPRGTKIVEPTSEKTDKKEQDTYWRDAVRGLQGIRGDTPMKDIETQRNAAIQAYNRLKDIEYTGKAPNPIDYIDILGQVYKARTGTAPTQEVLKEAKQATSVAAMGKFWTLATGQQMPGTSKDIAASLKDMVAHMGMQADDLHEGYMQAHGASVFNPAMSDANKAKLSKIARGKSFADATGVKPEDFDVHLQAIKWAQANPNDPRSAQILQKALQEKAATSGGSGGL